MLLNLNLLQTNSVYEITWNKIKFQSSTSLLKNTFRNPFPSTPFANTFRNPLQSMKLDEVFQSFIARVDCLKNSIFTQTDFVYVFTWKKSNFQSLNKSFKIYNLFGNPFIARDNSFRFKTYFYWLKNVNFLQSGSVNEIKQNNSIFQSSNRMLKQFNLFANRFRLWNYLK